jgi:hypothetical protein
MDADDTCGINLEEAAMKTPWLLWMTAPVAPVPSSPEKAASTLSLIWFLLGLDQTFFS